MRLLLALCPRRAPGEGGLHLRGARGTTTSCVVGCFAPIFGPGARREFGRFRLERWLARERFEREIRTKTKAATRWARQIQKERRTTGNQTRYEKKKDCMVD